MWNTFHFALYKYLKTSDSNAIIKLEKRFFLLRRVGYVSTSYYNSSLGIRYFCCLCLRWQCFVYSARASESQIPMEDWLRDSVFVFPSPCDLCDLVCILLWFEYLTSVVYLYLVIELISIFNRKYSEFSYTKIHLNY